MEYDTEINYKLSKIVPVLWKEAIAYDATIMAPVTILEWIQVVETMDLKSTHPRSPTGSFLKMTFQLSSESTKVSFSYP